MDAGTKRGWVAEWSRGPNEPCEEAGARDWIQVAANGLVPTYLALTYSFATVGCSVGGAR